MILKSTARFACLRGARTSWVVLLLAMMPASTVIAQTGANVKGNEHLQLGTSNRGWEDLARTLDAITPSIDTDETPSGTQITDRIEDLINRGQAEQALALIDSREAQLTATTAPGTDVQLMFQKARALAALDQTQESQAVYQEMTIRFPELSEPWNNLAVIYIQNGSLDEAEFALKTALMNNPEYASALANLADVRLLMALRDYKKAAQMRDAGAIKRLKALESVLKPN